MIAEIKECTLLERTGIKYANKTIIENIIQASIKTGSHKEDSLDFARIIQADNIKLTADLAKVKTERDAAIETLERIMLQGGSNTDTCAYCGNESCYNRGGHNVCNPVWIGKQYATKLLNCGECDSRWICEIEEKDCDRLYHPSDTSERKEVLTMKDSKKKSVCPFYKGGKQNTICCETGIQYATVCIEFRDKERKNDHMERFCTGAHNECALARNLNSLKEVEAKDVESIDKNT